jgi:hypothetical protein
MTFVRTMLQQELQVRAFIRMFEEDRIATSIPCLPRVRTRR